MHKLNYLNDLTSCFRRPEEGKPDNPNAPSRGEIIKEYLINSDSPQQFLEKFKEKASNYNGVNLLFTNLAGEGEYFYYSNIEE